MGLLLISAYLARRVADLGGRLELVLRHPVPLLILAAAITLVFLLKPRLGLLSLMFSVLLVPFGLGAAGSNTQINAAILHLSLLIFLWFFDMIARQKKITVAPSPTLLPLMIFVVVALIAFGMGQIPWFAYSQNASLAPQFGGLVVFILSAGAFLYVGNQVSDIFLLKKLTWIFLGLGGLYIAGTLVPILVPLTKLLQRGTTGSLFWTWLVALAFSQAVFNQKLKGRWRVILGGLVLATFYVAFFRSQGWKSGWIPPLVSVAAILWIGRHRLRLPATLAAGVFALINFPQFQALLTGDEQYSLMTRFEAWYIITEIVKVNPVFGLGPANYYWYTPLFPILGYYVRFNSHNNYIDIIAQIGLLGLVAFIWLVWEIGRLGWKLKREAPEGFARAYVIGALGGLAGMLVAGMLGDWIFPFVYNIGLNGFRASILGWLFLGGLVALDKMRGQPFSASRFEDLE